MQTPEDKQYQRMLSRKARVAAVIIAVAMLSWMGLQFLGGRLGWPAQLALAFDLLAGVALLWGLVLTYQVYQGRRGPH